MVHKDFVCHNSPALKVAFTNDRVEETDTHIYKIKDASVEAFEYLVRFIYSQRVDIPTSAKAENGTDNFLTFAELWILGERFLMPKLQNQATNAIWELSDHTRVVPTNIFHYVYKKTTHLSKLRWLVITFCILDLTREEIWDRQDDFPKDLLRDTLVESVPMMCSNRCVDMLVNETFPILRYQSKKSEGSWHSSVS